MVGKSKYFSLIRPSLLEPMHGDSYQRYQLQKLLKLPGNGRYENARFFTGIAQQLGVSNLDLAAVLHRRNGAAHGYWRVGTTSGETSEWPRMRDGGFAAVGWPALGDLSSIEATAKGKEALRVLLEQHYPNIPQVIGRNAQQLFNVVHGAQERDLVVAMEGTRVLGIGPIIGPYFHAANDGPFPNRRPVQWLRLGEWKLSELEGLQTSFVPLKKPINHVGFETLLLGTPREPTQRPPRPRKVEPDTEVAPPPLTGTLARIQSVLARKRQVILYGPPGTGKTYWAEKAVEELAARSWFNVEAAKLDEGKRTALRTEGAIELCSFHPAFGYEDFLEGYRASQRGGALAFELRPGIFKRLCVRAAKSPLRSFFLIIDEINRGDIPRIFGELLTVLEREKRGKAIALPLSGEALVVPDNVYVIGTMNTADRSIALLDAALRRRFGFVELLPDTAPFASVAVGGVPLGPWLEELNRRIVKNAGRDARHLQVGHSYLLPGGKPVRELARFAEILRDDIIPLLEEYCYEDIEALERILGPAIVQKALNRVDASLFEPERQDALVQAILSSFDGITSTLQAVQADASEAVEDEEGGESSETT